MNAIKNIKLNVALGAVLVAASMTANAAQANDFDNFTRQARASVLAEATRQPGPDARVEELRGAFEGARILPLEATVAHQGEQALAAIRSEQITELRKSAPVQLARSLEGARIAKRMPPVDRRTEKAIAAVRAEQLETMRRQAPSQISASLANARVVENVALAGAGSGSGSSD